VVTSQETDLQFAAPRATEAESAGTFWAQHEPAPLPIRSAQIELPLVSKAPNGTIVADLDEIER
jgi:hypothetical protein